MSEMKLVDLVPMAAMIAKSTKTVDVITAALRMRPALLVAAQLDDAAVYTGVVEKVALVKTVSETTGEKLPGKVRITYAPTKPTTDKQGNLITEETIETDWAYPGSVAEHIGLVAKGNVGQTCTFWKLNAEDPSGQVSQGFRRVVWLTGPNPPGRPARRDGQSEPPPARTAAVEAAPPPSPVEAAPSPARAEPEAVAAVQAGPTLAQEFASLFARLDPVAKTAYKEWAAGKRWPLRPTDDGRLAEAVAQLRTFVDAPAAAPPDRFDPEQPANVVFGDGCARIFDEFDAWISDLGDEAVMAAVFDAWCTWQAEHEVFNLTDSMTAGDFVKAKAAVEELRNRFRPIFGGSAEEPW